MRSVINDILNFKQDEYDRKDWKNSENWLPRWNCQHTSKNVWQKSVHYTASGQVFYKDRHIKVYLNNSARSDSLGWGKGWHQTARKFNWQ